MSCPSMSFYVDATFSWKKRTENFKVHYIKETNLVYTLSIFHNLLWGLKIYKLMGKWGRIYVFVKKRGRAPTMLIISRNRYVLGTVSRGLLVSYWLVVTVSLFDKKNTHMKFKEIEFCKLQFFMLKSSIWWLNMDG